MDDQEPLWIRIVRWIQPILFAGMVIGLIWMLASALRG